MSKRHIFAIISIILALLYLGFFFGGLASVPFHPDETTQIFMSSDFRVMLSQPASLFYTSEKPDTLRQQYRLADSPLTRTVVGKGLTLTRQTRLEKDWDWSATWDQNIKSGAYPPPTILVIARLFVSLLFPVGLFAFFFTLRSFTGRWLSLIGVVLLAMNSLLLLHMRRAMAESLFISLFLLLLWRLSKPFSIRNTLWVSIFLGLLLQAKQLGLPILVMSILILSWLGIRKTGWKSLLPAVLIPVGSVLILTYLLNPVMWQDPIRVAPLMLAQRQLVSQNQLDAFSAINGNLALNTPVSRILAVLAQTYFAPPAFFDVGNYSIALKSMIGTYSSTGLNLFFSGWIWGSILLILTIAGFILYGMTLLRHQREIPPIVPIVLLIGLAQFVVYAYYLTIGFQRYYLVFIPISLVVSIFGIHHVIQKNSLGIKEDGFIK